MKKIIIILLVFLLGCSKEYVETNSYLDLYEYEVVSTVQTTYAHVYYIAMPYSRVFWTSPDTVIIEGEKTCIVCCSTYTNKDGKGQQLVILPYTYSNKIWTVMGYIDNLVRDTIYIK